MNFYIKLAILSSFLFSSLSHGQEDFDLFNPDRGKPPAPPPAPAPKTPPANPFAPPTPPKPPEPPPPPKPQPPQKDFTLRGTSIIGDHRAAMLQAPDGKEIIQYLEDNKPTLIKDYKEFTLLTVEGRKVTIKYPDDSPCRTPSPEKKLQCSADQKTATLELMVLGALPPQPPMMPPQPPPPQPTAMTPPPQNPPTPFNPFAAAVQQQQNLSPEEQKRRQEEQQRRAELYKNFKRQVIKDEDVPPGMRVIHTPFGDRLVPDTRQ